MSQRNAEETQIKLFIAYAHEDKQLLNELVKHFSSLKREELISVWYDREIKIGDVWEDEIKKELESADIIMPLISSDFIASNYCFEEELGKALERHQKGTARIMPVILRDCDWKGLSHIQAAPTDGLPVTLWPDKDSAYKNVALALRQEVSRLIKSRKNTDLDSVKKKTNF